MKKTPPKDEAYRLIEEWCAKNPGTGATLGLMRLVLSLYNGRAFSFSIPVCIWSLDGARLEWAKAIILDYIDRGENDDLLELACVARLRSIDHPALDDLRQPIAVDKALEEQHHPSFP